MQNRLIDYSPELDLFEREDLASTSQPSGIFGETEQMELASEFLAVRDEQGLDQFLGSLIKSVGNALKKAIPAPVFNAIGGVLKGATKAALPLAGGALGSLVGGPLGATIGSKLASVAGSALGLELEGLSPEDQEFEAARQFVRFAGEAVQNAVLSESPDPMDAAQAGTMAAARRLAPGLIDHRSDLPHKHRRCRRGRWVRRGRNIVVLHCGAMERADMHRYGGHHA